MYIFNNLDLMKKKINFNQKCLEQNKLLVKKKLVMHSFGNVSLRIDDNYFVIKPSGVDLQRTNNSEFPIININTGKVVKGKLKPSSDTPTHLEIYKKFLKIKSISHTHSLYATAWAQSGKAIPLIGTTHADYWQDDIPLVKFISKKNLNKNYEQYTGKLIIDKLRKLRIDAYSCPGVIVSGHGPFTWGVNENSAVLNSEILEFIAKTAYLSNQIKVKSILPKYISKKHFERKHGKKAYYGQ
jgi:L-ribulose-5-phosphate 4-epimerase